MMDCEVKEYFSILLEACHVEEISLDVAYRQLRELLERLCRTQMPDGSLQALDGGGDTCRTLSPATPCGCHLYSGTARQRTDKEHARLFSVCR